MEDKKYSVVGSVTIGTDEYRDLVRNSIEQENSADDYRRKWWSEQEKVKNLQQAMDKITPKYEAFNKFLKSDDAIATKYKLYQIEQQQEDNDNE